MTLCRRVPFLTFVVSPKRKVKINLSGCNFDCRGCFAIAKQEVGRALSVEELLNLLIKSCQFIYGEMIEDVQFTGGEPTMNTDYLLSLIRQLRELQVSKIGISTNGHLLGKDLVKELRSLDVNYIKLDLKAYHDKIHKWYTGESNAKVLKAVEILNRYGLNFYVRTIFIPDVIDFGEIEEIARFLSKINKGITYKIYQFSPEYVKNNISKRRPTEKKMLKAFNVARSYLDHVEFYTTNTAYKPDPYKCIEVRSDELLEDFKRIDEISKLIIKDWDMQYLTMNQILTS